MRISARCRGSYITFVVAGLVLLTLSTSAAAAPQADPPKPAAPASTAKPTLSSHLVQRPPAIDGVLDDDAWREAPSETGEWLSYNPLHGEKIPQTTRTWIAHDSNFLYFAFQCDDPDPAASRPPSPAATTSGPTTGSASASTRWGRGSAYHLIVNPSGVQLDMFNSVSGGEDESPDYVWDSAGRTNDKGYAVEMRVPLQTIRFRGGQDVRMGILFWRRVSRTGVSVAWPPLEPGKWVFEKHAQLQFGELKPRLRAR